MNTLAIDFGTTKSLAASWEEHQPGPKTFRIGMGRDDWPTTIHVDSTGQRLFGDEADEQEAIDPAGYLRRVKRHLGNPAMQMHCVHGQKVPVVELIASYLGALRQRAERGANGAFERTILTVPTLYGEAQRADLRRAAEMARLPGVELLEEPLAAGIAFLHDRRGTGIGGQILVFDWGGGTLDLAVIEQREETFHINADLLGGHPELGGEDIDEVLFQLVGERLHEKQINLETQNRAVKSSVLRKLREMKRQFSTKESVSLHTVLDGRPVDLAIARADFDKAVEPFVDRALDTVEVLLQACGAAGFQAKNILLAGGTAQLGLVSTKLASRFGLRPVTWDRAIEAVALGAAIRARDATRFQETQPRPILPVPPRPVKEPEPPVIRTAPSKHEAPTVPEWLDDTGKLAGELLRKGKKLAGKGARAAGELAEEVAEKSAEVCGRAWRKAGKVADAGLKRIKSWFR